MRLLFIIFVIILSGCQTGYYRGPPSDHFDGKKFFYPGERNKPRNTTYELFSLWVAILQNPWSQRLPSINFSKVPQYSDPTKVTFINHSTVLLQGKRINILMDPIYSYRASPLPWIGPARVRKPGIPFQKLPKIDVVLISHNHYDHLDIATLKKLDKLFHPLFIVPLGNKILLNSNGITNVKEMDWWQSYEINDAEITFLPAHHSAQRWLYDFNWTLWGSFGIKLNRKAIYFAGDTGYANHFQQIRKRWGRPDFSFIPIGAYEPRKLLHEEHVNPEQAVQIHLELGSTTSMGIHWGTFQLSAESIDQPIIDLARAKKQYGVSDKEFFIIQEGVPVHIPK